MARMARDPKQRFGVNLGQLADTVKMLVQRTVVLEDGCYVTPYPAQISPGYTSGQPTVVMPNGATKGPYPCLSSYTPTAGDQVLLIPVGQSYVVAGTY